MFVLGRYCSLVRISINYISKKISVLYFIGLLTLEYICTLHLVFYNISLGATKYFNVIRSRYWALKHKLDCNILDWNYIVIKYLSLKVININHFRWIKVLQIF